MQLMDATDLTGKAMECSGGPHDSGRDAQVHNYPADLCIMVVLHSVSYPCSFKEFVDIFGLPSNRLLGGYHAAIEYIYFRYRNLVDLETWQPYVFCEWSCPYDANIALIDGTFTPACRPGGLRNVQEKN